jgi:hypothetical protein
MHLMLIWAGQSNHLVNFFQEVLRRRGLLFAADAAAASGVKRNLPW